MKQQILDCLLIEKKQIEIDFSSNITCKQDELVEETSYCSFLRSLAKVSALVIYKECQCFSYI